MFKKIFFTLGIIILLIVGAGVAIPYIYKDRIIEKVKGEINSKINARVDFGVFDFTILRSFPDFTVSVSDLTVSGAQEFEGDTLARIGVTYVRLDLMSIFRGGKIDIKQFDLEEPHFNFIVLENGKANWDIMKPDDATGAGSEASSFHVGLKRYSIENGQLAYDDKSLAFSMKLENFNHVGKGDFTQDLFTLTTTTQSEKTEMVYEGVPYLSGVKSDLQADIDMDLPNMKFTMKQNKLKLNELLLDVDGFVAMPADDIDMDIKFKSTQSDFKNFISLIPVIYAKDFEQLTASGTMALSGYVTGKYNDNTMPAFGLALNINNGMFKYPSLPQSLKEVVVDLKIDKPQGATDLTKINLSKLHFVMGTNPFDAKLFVTTPVSDPNIDMEVKGKINLGEVSKLVKLDTGTQLGGMMTADMGMKGKISAIESKKYQDFDAHGQMVFANVEYKTANEPALSVRKGMVKFNPASLGVEGFEGKYGKSEFQGGGQIDNVLGYIFRDDKLKASFNFNSTLLDLNEFMTDATSASGTAAKKPEATEVLLIPANLDVTLTTSIAKVLYEDWVIENVTGNMLISNQEIVLKGVSMKTLEGIVGINGTYSSVYPESPTIDYDIVASDMDINKTFKTFDAVKKMAPIAERTTGKFTTTLKIAGRLDKEMNPVLNSLNGKGVLKTLQVTVNGFEPISKLGEVLKIDKFKTLSLSDINVSFKFLDGRVYADPFDLKMGEIASQVAGSNGFDETIDYIMAMSIPRAMFGAGANSVLNDLILKANNSGANFSVGEKINVDAIIKGTVKNPQISTSLKDAGKNLMNDLKSQAQAEIDKKKQELEDKARAEADRLKQEAEDKARGEVDKVKKEAEDRAKAEQDKIKAEADRLKKEAEAKAKKDAEDKLKGVFRK